MNIGNHMELLPCQDSEQRAQLCRTLLDIPFDRAADLGRSAIEITRRGWYENRRGKRVDIRGDVRAAVEGKHSIPPDDPLSFRSPITPSPAKTQIQVCNETTFHAAYRLAGQYGRSALLNFANGTHPGGGFLQGATAQEEVLCRSSALFAALEGDPMYEFHLRRTLPDSSDWIIYAPGVPVFRSDDGQELDEIWKVDVLTCAAPYAPLVGADASAILLEKRVYRLLETAAALGCRTLVLGAWGCGAFENDPDRTALDFRRALESSYDGVFDAVVFAVADWSPDRYYFRPFCRHLGAGYEE